MTKRTDSNDRLIGIRPREMRDFFGGCNEPGSPIFLSDAAAFMRVWCGKCRRSECIRAKGVVRAWERRMEEQPDYLINEPRFSDMTDPRHQEIAKLYFASLKQKAERLEIAAARQDWEIPEGPTDGTPTVASSARTEDFDVAVRALARATGKKEPELPREEERATTPTFFEQSEEATYETQYPSSTVRGKSYRVALEGDGRWTCECDGFRHVAHCKHLDEVRAWYEEQLRNPQPPEPASPPAAPPMASEAPARDTRLPPETRPINTPMPQSGVMVGGGAAPTIEPRRPPAPPRPSAPVDPWTPRQDTVIESGATVTLRPKRKP